MTVNYVCKPCGVTDKQRQGTWWFLQNYHGLSGQFCPDCYDKVSHDSYGRPENPKQFTMMLLKLTGQQV